MKIFLNHLKATLVGIVPTVLGIAIIVALVTWYETVTQTILITMIFLGCSWGLGHSILDTIKRKKKER